MSLKRRYYQPSELIPTQTLQQNMTGLGIAGPTRREKISRKYVAAQVISLINEGKSISKAAKLVGCSYKRAKHIAEQERS